jgi:aminoglycoside 3-N-acetyltransferase
MAENTVSKEDLVRDLTQLGVKKGDLLNVKCSMKSIGKVQGGARTLIDALIEVVGPEGTIVTDSFIIVFREKEAKNKPISDENTPSYAGALANAMIEHPLAKRSKHPVQKFVAIGAIADELTSNHGPNSYAYNVLRVMCSRGGKNLKIGTDEKVVGVGTTHVAIGILRFKQLRQVAGVYYLDDNGKKEFFERNWAGICADGLIKFIPFYEKGGAVISKGTIGQSEAKITDMRRTLEIELEILRKDPTFFMCKKKDCIECQVSWEFSPEKRLPLLFKYLFSLKFKSSLKVGRMLVYKHRYYPSSKGPFPEDL